MKRPIELLSPAGNMDKLKMAIRYGAVAVYCAGQAFGLRASSSNFSNEELKEAVTSGEPVDDFVVTGYLVID